jgi:hypothetical protein
MNKVAIAKAGELDAFGKYVPAEGLRLIAKQNSAFVFDEVEGILYVTKNVTVNLMDGKESK